ncbi:igLON family member 5 isoform X2 [Pantherophis guttatus]|uniref:IgLON family member 5 isoform X2 n=1 Tax=Pantherophis guttatus TaxID=94885 RepID=A0A6P9CA99_PANGU|nr:igLON family member 5 isoform X2 [Pantherophis guttatus]
MQQGWRVECESQPVPSSAVPPPSPLFLPLLLPRLQNSPSSPSRTTAGEMNRVLLAALLFKMSILLLSQGLLVRGADFSQPADNYTVCQGDNATLSCYIDQQVTRVAWLNRSNILYAGNDKWSIDLRVQLLQYSPSEFSIMISHVDVYDEGLYTCSFQTQDKPHTSQVYLIVYVPARIVNISAAVTVNEGSNVNLLCLAVGKPEPTVIWRQLKDGFTSEGEYLEISEINREQAGEYACITANGVSTPDIKHVLITVNYPPIITDVKDSRPLIGKTALLRCEAMAVPAAEFQWFKDDKQLISGSDGLQIQNERTRSILLFTNVTVRHYGNYTCLASNSLGSYNVSLRLIRPGSLDNVAVASTEPPVLLGLLSSVFVTLLFKI